MRPQIHELPAIRHSDVIALVRSRRNYQLLRAVPVVVDGVVHQIAMIPRKTNLPGSNAPQLLLQCEKCNGGARVLRLWKDLLICTACCRRANIRYESQRPYLPPKEIQQFMEEQPAHSITQGETK